MTSLCSQLIGLVIPFSDRGPLLSGLIFPLPWREREKPVVILPPTETVSFVSG